MPFFADVSTCTLCCVFLFLFLPGTKDHVCVFLHRLVPMRSRAKYTTANNNVVELTEYDGLESGELAWVYGRHDTSTGVADRGLIRSSAHQMGGLGSGPDRMQRLAFTAFVETVFENDAAITGLYVDLMRIPLNISSDNDTQTFRGLLHGSGPLYVPDVPWLAQTLLPAVSTALPNPAHFTNAAGLPEADPQLRGVRGLAAGLLVVDRSPFLHGKIIDVDLVKVPHPLAPNDASAMVEVPRNLADKLAFDALFAQLGKVGLFDWTPDGIVLSKLESPTGDTLASSELDARQAMLFNVALQGPTITKTWTGNPKLATMPLDKVFMLLVAEIDCELGTAAPVAANFGAATKAGVFDVYKAGVAPNAGPAARQAAANLSTLDDGMPTAVTSGTALATYAADMNTKYDALTSTAAFGHPDLPADFDSTVKGLMNNTTAVKECGIRKFRWMRATSSYLAQYSHYKPGNTDSRCGLKLGFDVPNGLFASEFILGGWCIGTVLDNSASRSTIGHQVRIAPASMAININVNVEWMSGDQLHRKYADVDGWVEGRGQEASRLDAGGNAIKGMALLRYREAAESGFA